MFDRVLLIGRGGERVVLGIGQGGAKGLSLDELDSELIEDDPEEKEGLDVRELKVF